MVIQFDGDPPSEPVPDPCPQCMLDGHRDILDGWGYTRYLCPDHGKWVIFRWPAEQGENA